MRKVIFVLQIRVLEQQIFLTLEIVMFNQLTWLNKKNLIFLKISETLYS